MIRISAGRDAILRGLGDDAGSWLGQARALTNENQLARRHQKREFLWSRTKTVLAALQGHLCAYCGRRLGDAGQDWTVDHFRPKGAVAACDILPAGAVDVGGRSATGYYLLAYEHRGFQGVIHRAGCRVSDGPQGVHGVRAYRLGPGDGDGPVFRRVVHPFGCDVLPVQRSRVFVAQDDQDGECVS